MNREDDLMEQAGPEPRPGKPDRGGQRRPRGQEARLARDAPRDSSPAEPSGSSPESPGESSRAPRDKQDQSDSHAPAPQPSGSAPPARPADLAEISHPVVVGYDGSASSRNALAYAAGFARRLGQPLLVVYVVPFGVYCEPMTGQVVYPVRERAELEPWLLGELDQTCDCEGLDVCVMTRRGNAARELAAAADSLCADALVVGAPSGRLHQLAGSIPSWLARHACCPVIVVP
jgi:nucleotide-binding universal stress UspA family protein